MLLQQTLLHILFCPTYNCCFDRVRYELLQGEALLINFAGFFLIIFTLTVVTLVYEHRFRRRPRPEGELLLSESERSQ